LDLSGCALADPEYVNRIARRDPDLDVLPEENVPRIHIADGEPVPLRAQQIALSLVFSHRTELDFRQFVGSHVFPNARVQLDT
jgi:hypothetical protein